MTEFYFDMEISYEDTEIIDALRRNERVPINKENMEKCKIITIQYQRLNYDGEPTEDINILKEWDDQNSEETILKKFASNIDKQSPWNFIPVGYNVLFDLGLFYQKSKKYGLDFDDWFVYHDMPHIDIKPIALALNEFKFKGTSLDNFTKKKHDGKIIPIWYYDKEYDKIEQYIRDEATQFLDFYKKLKLKMPEFRGHFEVNK